MTARQLQENIRAPLSEFPISDMSLGYTPQFEDAPSWIYNHDNPYLHGVYAPTNRELDQDKLEVIGELPNDLRGTYYRNGANPVFEPKNRYHPFDGDGMVHALHISDEGARYVNRWIDTPAFNEEASAGASVSPGVMGPFDYSVCEFGIKDTSNTDIFALNGDLVSLWYNAGHPIALDPVTLETRKAFHLDGRDDMKMSAHSKVDWNTGELLYFDYNDLPPYMTYGVANARGEVIHEVPIALPGPRLPHDIGFTKNYTVLHDLPFFHDLNILKNHKLRVLTFHRDMPARFGLIPRFGEGNSIHWFDCEPCYVLHVSNCWEEGDWVVMVGCRSINPMPRPYGDEGELSHMLAYMRLEANNYRWRFNLVTGEVREGDIDNLNTEFNKTNPLYGGRKNRYAYHQYIPTHDEGGFTLRFTSLVKYDNETGKSWRFEYGPGVLGSEAVYAPKVGATCRDIEDDGYVVNFVHDTTDWSSWFCIYNARDIEQGPIAKVRLPGRVPTGFHATWVPAF